MKVIIKNIRGGSCVADVESNTTILDLKKKIETDINIPLSQQTLVLFGKTLQDDKTIGFYPTIKDGTKLYVALKKIETLNVSLGRYLRQFYTDQQCTLIVEEFMKDFHNKVKNLSLDDLERIAKLDMDASA